MGLSFIETINLEASTYCARYKYKIVNESTGKLNRALFNYPRRYVQSPE